MEDECIMNTYICRPNHDELHKFHRLTKAARCG